MAAHARPARRPPLPISAASELELSVDVYNLTNANTVFAVRTTTGLTSDPRRPAIRRAPTQQIASFLSPTNVLAPRVARFNI